METCVSEERIDCEMELIKLFSPSRTGQAAKLCSFRFEVINKFTARRCLAVYRWGSIHATKGPQYSLYCRAKMLTSQSLSSLNTFQAILSIKRNPHGMVHCLEKSTASPPRPRAVTICNSMKQLDSYADRLYCRFIEPPDPVLHGAEANYC
jgi:hypothetical protein